MLTKLINMFLLLVMQIIKVILLPVVISLLDRWDSNHILVMYHLVASKDISHHHSKGINPKDTLHLEDMGSL